MKQKKGVSPIISTVLLVMIVLILAMIIFLWARGFIKESVSKEIAGQEDIAEHHCSNIKLESIVNADGSFGFRNIGNVPIYKFDLKVTKKDTGSSEIFEMSTELGGIANPGIIVLMQDIETNVKPYDEYEEVKVIPILLGKAKDGGTKEFRCSESQAIII